MKPRDPIQFSAMIQYYTSDKVLKRPKDELIRQMQDLITISDFLINRIPGNMKSIKQTARTQHKIIKNFSQHLRSDVYEMAGLRPDKIFNLKSAYQQLSHFCFNKEQERQYVQKTIPEKQMKLKFLQSQNLPDNFMWYKPTNKGKIIQKNQQNYFWCSHFNSNLNMIEIISQKYRILVGLTVLNDKYIWKLQFIQSKASQQNVPQFISYFQTQLMPQLKQKFPNNYEENMLACLQHFSYFLQLLQINQTVVNIINQQNQAVNQPTKKFFSKQITYKYNQKSYELNFSPPKVFENPATLQITQTNSPLFLFQITFKKKQVVAIFNIQNGIVLKCLQQFKYDNFFDILAILSQLIKFGEHYLKLLEIIGRQLQALQQCIFIKINNSYWCMQNTNQNIKSQSYMIQSDGLYIGKKIQNRFVYCTVLSSGKLSSMKVSRDFIAGLLKYVPSFEYIFYFMYVIQQILEDNQKREHSLDYYTVHQPHRSKTSNSNAMISENDWENIKVSLFMRRKSNIQDLMVKAGVRNTYPYIEQQSYSSFKAQAQMNIGFQQLLFYHFIRDPDINKHTFSPKDQWKQIFNRKFRRDPNRILDINKVVQAIRYVQTNTTFKCFIQKRIKSEQKDFFKIDI